MGIGLVVCVSEAEAERTMTMTGGYRIGTVESGQGIELT